MRFGAALAIAGAVLGVPAWGAPARVVSLNVCTDQLAHLLAAPGQLISVSALAHDPRSSAYADALADIPANGGGAEEVVLLEPDLILAGTFTTRATVEMLEGLGHEVALFPPVTSLSQVTEHMARMGALLGREDAARNLIAAFEAGLDRTPPLPDGPRTLLYYPMGSTAGRGTLADALMEAAGLTNIAAEMGLSYGTLQLEQAVLAAPDLILTPAPYARPTRATDLPGHPALRAVAPLRRIEAGAAWSCETPALLQAIADLRALAEDAR
ncbi:iron complex transport system substrate-binding protein [Roseivivax lentus]|uniref:Iron complex transport system substrate-binding protein n=2 Tax=Roseivivax lentus TaxID=633194 RepID=A0A1N7NZW9_9RHOB|nr:iron complex transport system substrate-binding protein [Roseivivax lentus]